MSQENVEVVRAVWKVFTDRGLEAALDSFSERFAEDCVFEDFPELPDHADYRGKEGWGKEPRTLPRSGGISSWSRMSSSTPGRKS